MANSTEYKTVFTAKDDMSSTIKNVKNELDSVGKSATTASEKINKQFDRIVNSSAPLKRQLRDLQKMMTEMNYNGQANSEEFIKVAQAAGRIKDALSDTQDAIKRFSSDTMNIEAATQAVQGLAAAGSVASGVMGLFGTKNEEVQRAILKVQSAMAILNGVQSIANILNKDSVLMLKLKSIQENIAAAATAKDTVATTANTVATNINTTAQKGWNIAKAIGKAMFGDFTGLLLLGAGAMLTYAMTTESSTSAQDSLNSSIEKGTTFLNKQVDANKEATKEINNEKNKIFGLKAILDDTNVSYDNKVKALKQLQSIIPSVNGMIDSEGVYHGNAASAIRDHIKALDELQTALSLFKLGQSIQDELSQAQWQKFKADQQVSAKEGNVAASERQIAKSTGIVEEENAKNIGHRDTKRQIQASKDLRSSNKQLIENKKNLKLAKENQQQADNDLKTAEKQEKQYNQFKKTRRVNANAMAAVTMAGGDASKAVDYYIGRDGTGGIAGNKPRSTGGGSTTNTRTTPTPKKEEPKAITDSLDDLQKRYNELKSNISKGLFTKEGQAADLKSLKDLENKIQQKKIALGWEIDPEVKAKEELEKELDNISSNAGKIKLTPDFSDFEKATGQDKFDITNIGGIEQQMNFNSNLVNQLKEIIGLYETWIDAAKKHGLTEIDAYSKASQSLENYKKALENVSGEQTNLRESASNLYNEQKQQKEYYDKVDAYSEGITRLGGAFSALSGATEDSTSALLQYSSNVLNAIAEQLPMIMKLFAAKKGMSFANIIENATEMHPFPVALAAMVAGIASVTAAFASIPKFEKGGIVGGNSFTGDKILARLNSGERVFTRKQSDKLTNLLDNGVSGGLGGFLPRIEFVIRGDKLYGVLKNYSKEQFKVGKTTGIK